MRRTSRIASAATIAALAALGAALAPASPAEQPPTAREGFELTASRALPKRALFDGRRPIRLRFRFRAAGSLDLRIKVVSVASRRLVDAWTLPEAEPGRHKQRWPATNLRGRAARDGRYEFRVGPLGGRDRYAGRLRLRGHVYPVAGRHGARGPVGEFGAGRNGGRVHEGYDILAACGTPLVAVRGGTVKRAGYDDRLYGHYLLINARKSRQQYFYSHLIGPPRQRRGDRVRTGERVGRVGQSGNARSTPCHLHFELRRAGRAIDPKPKLRRWDRWS